MRKFLLRLLNTKLRNSSSSLRLPLNPENKLPLKIGPPKLFGVRNFCGLNPAAAAYRLGHWGNGAAANLSFCLCLELGAYLFGSQYPLLSLIASALASSSSSTPSATISWNPSGSSSCSSSSSSSSSSSCSLTTSLLLVEDVVSPSGNRR